MAADVVVELVDGHGVEAGHAECVVVELFVALLDGAKGRLWLEPRGNVRRTDARGTSVEMTVAEPFVTGRKAVADDVEGCWPNEWLPAAVQMLTTVVRCAKAGGDGRLPPRLSAIEPSQPELAEEHGIVVA